MKLIIKMANGQEAEINFNPKKMNLWNDKVEIWLEDDHNKLLDYKQFIISKRNVMTAFKGGIRRKI